jgi:hypothetical protein
MIRRIMHCLSLLAAISALACEARDGASECEAFWGNLDVIVLSPSDPARTIVLEEVWRVGGSNPGQEIADLASVKVSGAGHAAIVDFSLGQASVISPHGEWMGQWGRRGRGPGELTMPVAANWSGDTLVLYDIEQSKISRYRNGESLGDSRISPELSAPVVASGRIDFVAVRSDGTVLLQQPLESESASDTSRITVLLAGPTSVLPDTLVSARVQHVAWDQGVMPHPAGAVPRIAVGPNNWFAITASDGSRRVLLAGGAPARELCGTGPAAPPTDEERGRGTAPRGFEAGFQALGAAPAPRDLSSVGRIVVGPNGDVWIDARRPRPFTQQGLLGVPGGRLDAYSSTGEHIGTVHVPETVTIQGMSDSIAIGLEFNVMDEAWVIGYRVRR